MGVEDCWITGWGETGWLLHTESSSLTIKEMPSKYLLIPKIVNVRNPSITRHKLKMRWHFSHKIMRRNYFLSDKHTPKVEHLNSTLMSSLNLVCIMTSSHQLHIRKLNIHRY